jgi:hypothetical protein
MTKLKKYVWLKSIGLLSLIIMMLIGASSCKGRRQMTKYGVPAINEYDEPITKYGVPGDYDEINEEPIIDTTDNN